jgi:hypothetical protein
MLRFSAGGSFAPRADPEGHVSDPKGRVSEKWIRLSAKTMLLSAERSMSQPLRISQAIHRLKTDPKKKKARLSPCLNCLLAF